MTLRLNCRALIVPMLVNIYNMGIFLDYNCKVNNVIN